MPTQSKNPRRQRLKLVKIKAKHLPIILPLLLLATNEARIGRSKLANFRKNVAAHKIRPLLNNDGTVQEPLHHIALKNIYVNLKLSSQFRPLVKVFLNIYFEQITRGNSKTKKTSGWKLRDQPKVNAQLAAVIKHLEAVNFTCMQEVRKVAFAAKGSELTVSYTFDCGTPEQAQAILALLQQVQDVVPSAQVAEALREAA